MRCQPPEIPAFVNVLASSGLVKFTPRMTPSLVTPILLGFSPHRWRIRIFDLETCGATRRSRCATSETAAIPAVTTKTNAKTIIVLSFFTIA
jgi:hypothetical protein